MRLGVIPARGGSKRIPRKNIREFLGVPIVAYPIRAALDSGCFDKLVVSTDDEEIAGVAKGYGAGVLWRPAELSGDHTPTSAVICHALDSFLAKGTSVREVCCVYATAPFVTPQLLRRAHELLASTGSAYAFTATEYPFPIQRAVVLDAKGRVSMLHPEHAQTRSQDLPTIHHDAGQLYWGTAEAYRGQLPVFAPHSVAVPVPRHQVQDIDTEEDWILAENLYRSLGRTTSVEG